MGETTVEIKNRPKRGYVYSAETCS